MSTKKAQGKTQQDKKPRLRGGEYLKSFVHQLDGKQVLTLPVEKAEKFLKEFLVLHKACTQEPYISKFMRSVFGFQQFNVKVETVVPATGQVEITARNYEEAKALAADKLQKGLVARNEIYLQPDSKKVAGPVKVGKATLSRG